MEAAVIGAGGWGTALAVLLASKGFQVSIWMRSQDVYKMCIRDRDMDCLIMAVKNVPVLESSVSRPLKSRAGRGAAD